jgi:tRNA(fMet)-specific endonuclease VapC
VSLRFLLDTNIVSESVRPTPRPGVLQALERYQDSIALATPVWHELLFGLERLPPSKKRRALERYLFTIVLPSFPLLPYDQAAAEWHARERARLIGLGRTPPIVDAQIAAISRVNGLTLVTGNRKDFEAYEGLEVVDWG